MKKKKTTLLKCIEDFMGHQEAEKKNKNKMDESFLYFKEDVFKFQKLACSFSLPSKLAMQNNQYHYLNRLK